MSDPRTPIGAFPGVEALAPAERARAIDEIAAAPACLRKAVAGLSDAQLDTPYRSGSWTARQVVHHLPDSHVNAYVRFKLALTEDDPTIRPYREERWAEQPEARIGPIEPSLALLDALHGRWVAALRGAEPAGFARTLVHPASGRHTVDWLVALYAWHGRHHVAHVTALRERMRW